MKSILIQSCLGISGGPRINENFFKHKKSEDKWRTISTFFILDKIPSAVLHNQSKISLFLKGSGLKIDMKLQKGVNIIREISEKNDDFTFVKRALSSPSIAMACI